MHFHVSVLFLALASVMVATPNSVTRALKRKVPQVVIAILFGIMLGPSVFGRIAPDLWQELFPKNMYTLDAIKVLVLALLGVTTGTHIDLNDIRGKGSALGVTMLSSLVVPLVLCAALGGAFYLTLPEVAAEGKGGLFGAMASSGVAGGVTALPVLMAVLMSMNEYHKTKNGQLALSLATGNDLMLWPLLVLVLAMVGDGGVGGVFKTLGLTGAFFFTMFVIVAPIFQRFLTAFDADLMKQAKSERWQLLVPVFSFALFSGAVTEWIGIHYLLGCLTVGMMVPKPLAHLVDKRVHAGLQLLMPFFFMDTGLRTVFDMTSPTVWIICIAMSVVSLFGKVVGTAIPARKLGLVNNKCDAFELGAFMGTKGLMEVVVLNMFRDAGVIGPIMFSGLLLMAVVTTALCKPMVDLVRVRLGHHRSNATLESAVAA